MENEEITIGDNGVDSTTDAKIVMLKLYSGDYIVGEKVPELEPSDSISLSNPRMLVMVPTMAGDVRMGLQSVCPFSEKLKKAITVIKSQVMCTVDGDELPKDLVNAYRSQVTGIKIATVDETAAINRGGDIIL